MDDDGLRVFPNEIRLVQLLSPNCIALGASAACESNLVCSQSCCRSIHHANNRNRRLGRLTALHPFLPAILPQSCILFVCNTVSMVKPDRSFMLRRGSGRPHLRQRQGRRRVLVPRRSQLPRGHPAGGFQGRGRLQPARPESSLGAALRVHARCARGSPRHVCLPASVAHVPMSVRYLSGPLCVRCAATPLQFAL